MAKTNPKLSSVDKNIKQQEILIYCWCECNPQNHFGKHFEKYKVEMKPL